MISTINQDHEMYYQQYNEFSLYARNEPALPPTDRWPRDIVLNG